MFQSDVPLRDCRIQTSIINIKIGKAGFDVIAQHWYGPIAHGCKLLSRTLQVRTNLPCLESVECWPLAETETGNTVFWGGAVYLGTGKKEKGTKGTDFLLPQPFLLCFWGTEGGKGEKGTVKGTAGQRGVDDEGKPYGWAGLARQPR